jgi:S1-C subfamily serine protease
MGADPHDPFEGHGPAPPASALEAKEEATMSRHSFHPLVAAAAAVALLSGATVAFAGGAKCAEQHAQADYQKMAEKMAAKGWLGLETESAAGGGYAVKAIAAGSPAEKAGFRVGDVLVALNGVKLGEENRDAVYKVKSTLGPGKQVSYTVKRAGAEQTVSATLAPVPREVLAEWLGEHVLDHTSTVVASN